MSAEIWSSLIKELFDMLDTDNLVSDIWPIYTTFLEHTNSQVRKNSVENLSHCFSFVKEDLGFESLTQLFSLLNKLSTDSSIEVRAALVNSSCFDLVQHLNEA